MTWIYNDNGFVLLQCQVHQVSGQDMSSIQGCLSLFTISGVACMVKLGWCESKGMKLNLEKYNQVHRDIFKKTWKNIYATSLYRLWCEANKCFCIPVYHWTAHCYKQCWEESLSFDSQVHHYKISNGSNITLYNECTVDNVTVMSTLDYNCGYTVQLE